MTVQEIQRARDYVGLIHHKELNGREDRDQLIELYLNTYLNNGVTLEQLKNAAKGEKQRKTLDMGFDFLSDITGEE